MWLVPLAWVLCLTGSAQAGEQAVFLEVHNTGPRLFQHVVEHKSDAASLFPGGLPKAVACIETDAVGARKLREAVAQLDREGTTAILSLLLDGVTEAGQRRYFLIRPVSSAPPAETDLRVAEEAGELRVTNQYFTAHIERRGRGGFPDALVFSGSGNRYDGFFYGDRLFAKERGVLHLRDDPDSTARVVSQGPLRVVVEAAARYRGPQGYASGEAKAVYRYVYRAYSPVVEVSCSARRADDYRWSEIHFLQVSRKDALFSRWVGGEPPERGVFTNSKQSRALSRWAVMHNADDAIGLGHPDGVVLYDGLDYVNYLQTPVMAWEKRTYENAARLYFGPAQRDPQRYAQFLAGAPAVAIRQLPVPRDPSMPAAKPKYHLGDEALALDFADEEAGLGLARLTNRLTGQVLVASPEEKPLLWRIELRGEEKGLKPITLDNRVEAKRSAVLSAAKLQFRWEGIPLDGEPNALSVTVEIEAKSDNPQSPIRNPQSAWRIKVENRSRRYGVWDVFFPVLSNVGTEERPDVAVPRGNWGVLYREAKVRLTGSYPSYDWPMQFLSANVGESGLYLACHDPEAWPKRFALTPLGEFHFQIPAPNQGIGGTGYEQPFPIVVGAYQGGWWQGARLYREWAAAHAPWTRRGPIARRSDYPKKLLDLGLWMLGGGHAKEAVPRMHEAAKLFQVPLGIHWYNWHEIPFDTYYPNYFPTKPGFAEGVKDLVGAGMVAMPYINGRLWDSGNENFKEALPFACKRPDGNPYLEEYGSGRKLAVMCPATRFWQDKVTDICRRLMTECGVNAIYIDQIAAAGPVPCFDKTHGHPVGGGSWWVDGYRQMLTRIRALAHAEGRDVILTTENNAEPYMDNVDAFLIWNPRYDNEIPMMTAAYSGLTTYFSSPSAVGDELRAFAASQGRDFLFGVQPGWMGFELLDPKNREKAECLRDLAAHRLAAAKFMAQGELLGELKPSIPVPSIEVTWGRGWGAKGAHQAVLPAVMATVWRAPDGELAIVATSWGRGDQLLRYRFDPDAWGGIAPGGRKPSHLLFTRLRPSGRAHAGYAAYGPVERAEVLEEREVLVLGVGPAPPRGKVLDELAEQSKAFLSQSRPPRLSGSVENRCRKLWPHLERAEVKDRRLAEAAKRCVGELLAAELGLRLSVETQDIRVAEGDSYSLTCAYSKEGRRPIELTEAWSDRYRDPLRLYEPAVSKHGRIGESGVVMGGARAPLLGGHTAKDFIGELRFAFPTAADPFYLTEPVRVKVLPAISVELQGSGTPRAGEEHLVRVAAANNRTETCSPTLALRVPPEWEVTPGRTLALGRMRPGERRSIAFLCRVPRDAMAGRARVSVSVSLAEAAQHVEVGEPRPEAKAKHSNPAPAIDGDIGEWAGAAPAVVERGRHVRIEGWRGPEDCSARVWTGWDAERLYVAAEVNDDVFDQKHSGFPIWQGDCIQMALCPGPPRGEPGYEGVIEFGLALTPGGPEVFQWVPVARRVEGAKLAVRQTPGRLVYEAAIPWASLGSWRPTPGESVGWSFTVNDADGGGFRGWLEWTPGICGIKDAALLGRLEFDR